MSKREWFYLCCVVLWTMINWAVAGSLHGHPTVIAENDARLEAIRGFEDCWALYDNFCESQQVDYEGCADIPCTLFDPEEPDSWICSNQGIDWNWQLEGKRAQLQFILPGKTSAAPGTRYCYLSEPCNYWLYYSEMFPCEQTGMGGNPHCVAVDDSWGWGQVDNDTLTGDVCEPY